MRSKSGRDLVQADDVGLQLVLCHIPHSYLSGYEDRERSNPDVAMDEGEESHNQCLRRIDDTPCWQSGSFEPVR